MQLKNRSTLAMAAASLMTATHIPSASADEWSHEASILYYGETDSRVTDASVKYKGVRTFNDGEKKLIINAGIDALTGASPNGVAPSNDTIVLTSASGNSTHTYPAGELPLDDEFKDTRVSASILWDQPILNDTTRANVGASFSKEYDYLHLGVSGGLSKELNNKNTTFSVGLAYSADTVDPVGKAPIALANAGAAKGEATKSKDTLDFMLGVTHILTKKTIMQLNYSYSNADGYLNDPYKWVSQVNNSGTIIENLHESRPDTRTGHNLYAALKFNVKNNDVLTTSARYHTDDWGIDSITADVKYRFALGNKKSIEPHIRYYHQSKADFYTPQLNSLDTNLPDYASADYRLAEFDAYTLGVTYRWEGANNRKWHITGELYTQDPADISLTTGQSGLDANPGFKAIMLSTGVKF